MKISWEKLSDDDANGKITAFRVCYNASKNPKDTDCRYINDGNTLQSEVNDLNEATTYNISVQATTARGFGPLGVVMNATTLEAGKRFYTRILLIKNNSNIPFNAHLVILNNF